jgi:hypothetical protein
VRTVIAILTALLLLASQAGVWSAPAVRGAESCCGTCAGACCVKSCDAPVAPEPLAPASASAAPALKLTPPPALVCGELPSAPFVSSFVAPRAPLVSQPLPLFLRQCVLLV